MLKFVACVPDDVGEKFKAWCAGQEKSPYVVLNTLIHKAIGHEYAPKRQIHPDIAAAHRLKKIEGKQRELGPGRRTPRTCGQCGRDWGDCRHTERGE